MTRVELLLDYYRAHIRANGGDPDGLTDDEVRAVFAALRPPPIKFPLWLSRLGLVPDEDVEQAEQAANEKNVEFVKQTFGAKVTSG